VGYHRIVAIERSVWQTFQSLPKNAAGRLSHLSVRHVLHNYFAKEHGWLIKGLERQAMQLKVTELHEMSILQELAPAMVEGLLQSRRLDRGLSMAEVVVMIASLERLIMKESLGLLEAAYKLNGRSVESQLNEASLVEVLTSYLVIFKRNSKGSLTDINAHHAWKVRMERKGTLAEIVDFVRDTVLNAEFASKHQSNPFAERQYSFEAAAQLVEEMVQGFGKWQNSDCRGMKEALMDLAKDGSGRVAIGSLYSQSATAKYRFSESTEYLQQIGALDETGWKPKVLIANYVAGPSNCIASSAYYSVCCLSDCEGVMNEVEAHIQAPAASPRELLSLVGNLSSPSVDAPRQLQPGLVQKLHAIAARNGGEVPLHGRLFAQWLHHAFPNDCPYPSTPRTAQALSVEPWLGGKWNAPEADRKRLADAARDDEPTEQHTLSQWIDDELLPLQDVPHQNSSSLFFVLRVASQMAMLIFAFHFVIARMCTLLRASQGGDGDKGGKLPLLL